MSSAREYLTPGTRIQLESGNWYEITGKPIGSSSQSIIYPAVRLLQYENEIKRDGFICALQECYPVMQTCEFIRDAQGQIAPKNQDEEGQVYLQRAQQMQLRAPQVIRRICQTGSQLPQICEASERILLSMPGSEPVQVKNTVTIMESLASAGQALSSYLCEYQQISPFQVFHIIQQVLFAIREIHQAGYLHLDLQDGTIFIRGLLENSSDIVSIINFESARPLFNGKTEPIEDRALFTTQGFSAPELLLHNDGSLQLGPEEDLYSVGCLILYLLTGRRYGANELIKNTAGKYLTRSDLKKMTCPKHLAVKMQTIIAHALEEKPANRYHSADEMLADVTDMINALQPYRQDLGGIVYDAFVSYRHSPVDSRVAKALQQRLEHFRAPRGIAKTRHPFKRIFVDDGELSSSADFSVHIREALKHASWLIVICSPETPKSTWVQLEIDTFLQYHDRSRILAILTDGEPENAFPPQLKAGELHHEVLAADARGKDIRTVLKKLRKDAILRIAAPMLGITYDTLKQRRKTYVFQRAAAAATVCLALTAAFSVYAVRQAQIISAQADRIAQEYENNLISQSQYLVKEANERLENNDPIGAVERLLAALPSEEQDRPVLPEAIYALSQALGVYRTPMEVANSMSAVGVFHLPEDSESTFFLDPTGSFLFSADSQSIYVWDTETYQVVQTYPASIENQQASLHCFSADLLVRSEPWLIYAGLNELSCRDYVSGELLWTVECASEIISAVLSGDKETVVMLETDRIELIDVSSGSVKREIGFQINEKLYLSSHIAVSEDTSKIAFSAWKCSSEDPNQVLSTVFLVDTESGSTEELVYDFYNVNHMLFVGDSLAIKSGKGVNSTIRNSYFDKTRYQKKTFFLWLYNLNSKEMEWVSSFDCAGSASSADRISAVSYEDGEISRDALIFSFTNYIEVVDRETGEMLREYELNDTIVETDFHDGGFEAVTSDGTFYSTSFQWDPGVCTVMGFTYFADNVVRVREDGRSHYYILQNTSDNWGSPDRIIKYEYEKSDNAYEEWGTFESDSLLSFSYLADGIVYDISSDCTLHLFDPVDSLPKEIALPGESGYDFTCLGLSADKRSLFLDYDSSLQRAICVVDIASGSCEMYEIPAPVEGEWAVEDLACWDGKIIFLCAAGTSYKLTDTYEKIYYNRMIIFSWVPGADSPEVLGEYQLEEVTQAGFDPESLSLYEYTAPVDYYVQGSFKLNDNAYSALFLLSNYIDSTVIYVSVDLSSGAVIHTTPDTFAASSHSQPNAIFQSDSGNYAVIFDSTYDIDEEGNIDPESEGTRFTVLDAFGQLVCTASFDYKVSFASDQALFFAPDDSYFCAVCGDGILRKYQVQSGILLSELDLNDYSSYFFSKPSPQILDDTTALLSMFSEGILLDLSDDTPAVIGLIKNCIGYDSASDRFVVACDGFTYSEYGIGSFHRYSTEDLIQLGRELISR